MLELASSLEPFTRISPTDLLVLCCSFWKYNALSDVRFS